MSRTPPSCGSGACGGEAGGGERPWVAVAGARPNFVKLVPLLAAAEAGGRRLLWVHAGQHRSRAMGERSLGPLSPPPPWVALPATRPGAGRVRRLARRIEPVLEALRPSLVVAIGDVDSTVAAAAAAARRGLPLAHVEAGLRSGERGMPEERNRRLVDRWSGRLHATEAAAVEHLAREGLAERARLHGNVVADALRLARPHLRPPPVPTPYALVTFHRQATVEDPARLGRVTAALERTAAGVRVVFPVHPRTRRRLGAGAARRLARAGVLLRPPEPYVAFLGLLAGAAIVVTDSGGVQVEACLLGTPCLTLRRRTEHEATVALGANQVLGTDPRRIVAAVGVGLARAAPPWRRPPLWDGRAALRIVADWVRNPPRPVIGYKDVILPMEM
jgi:UDP-N-acetylglucosamine 2-epimerase (non-hydrolysing)